ncbi:transposase, partial [Klebsiella pneumoniae]|uniref:transposase n=1 Tax=Klebsiella pneumoniae TaxID=573 RepID=UPI00345EC455
TGSNARWKWTTDYNRRSIAETAMYRVKQLFGGSLTLRDYDGQVAEAMALVRALNNVTDSEAFPGLIRQTHRKIRAAAADGAYDTRLCHDELRRKKISALIPPR